MAKRNGSIPKIIIGVVTFLLTSGLIVIIAWIWNASGYCKEIKTNTSKISEIKEQVKKDIIPKMDANSMAVFGIQKDIERLNEKVSELNTGQDAIKNEQTVMRDEQRDAFREILKRLPQ